MKVESVKRQYLSQQVADGIIQRIIKGFFKPGEKLPPERELSRIFLVTRTTVREALKILQALRLISVRQGDGVRVEDFMRNGSVELLGELLLMDGRLNTKAMRDILEARVLFGKTVAQLAAVRAKTEDLQTYEELIEKLQDADDRRFQELDWELFRTLTLCSDNLVFQFVLNSISLIYFRHWELFKPAYKDKENIIRIHKEVLKALKDRDQQRASILIQDLFETQKNSLLEEDK